MPKIDSARRSFVASRPIVSARASMSARPSSRLPASASLGSSIFSRPPLHCTWMYSIVFFVTSGAAFVGSTGVSSSSRASFHTRCGVEPSGE
eukprot:4307372-Prymnesium_polylepis.1